MESRFFEITVRAIGTFGTIGAITVRDIRNQKFEYFILACQLYEWEKNETQNGAHSTHIKRSAREICEEINKNFDQNIRE
jgi:hypothetical protein